MRLRDLRPLPLCAGGSDTERVIEAEVTNRRKARRGWLLRAAAFMAAGLAAAACGVVGSGDIITQGRQLVPFERIAVSGGLNVDVIVDPEAEQQVTVTFDDNLVERVLTRVSDDTLIIEFDGSVQAADGGRFVGVITDIVTGIEASGGSKVTGSGTTDIYALRASGGSDVELRDLAAREVDIDASGGSSVVLFATELATGDASGGSAVTVIGDPPVVAIDTSGGAVVEREN